MCDANLVRVLQRQTKRRVGLIPIEAVRESTQAIRTKIADLQTKGVEIAIVDALADEDLLRIGAACNDLKLLTAGSGVALGIAADLDLTGGPLQELIACLYSIRFQVAVRSLQAVVHRLLRSRLPGPSPLELPHSQSIHSAWRRANQLLRMH